jgi:hypothetical protein
VIVFFRRVVNAKWHRAFKTACCEQSLVEPLSPVVRARLDRLLQRDEKLRVAFELYEPDTPPLVVNLTMGIPDRARLEAFSRDVLAPAMTPGVSMEDVLRMLDAAGLTQFLQKYPIRATLQIVCRDHEVRDGEFVLRDCRVLPF